MLLRYIARRLGVDHDERFAGDHLSAQAHGQRNTGSFVIRRASKLGEPRQFAIVDMGDNAGVRRRQSTRQRRFRRRAHAALRFANALEFRPRTAARERLFGRVEPLPH